MALCYVPLRLLGSFQGGLAAHREEGVELEVQRVNAVQVGLGSFHGRDLYLRHQP